MADWADKTTAALTVWAGDPALLASVAQALRDAHARGYVEGCQSPQREDVLRREYERGVREERERLLRLASPYPLTDIVQRLADAADYLLHEHGCDALGHEGIALARDAGRRWLEKTTQGHGPEHERCGSPGPGVRSENAGASVPTHATAEAGAHHPADALEAALCAIDRAVSVMTEER